MSSFPCLSPNVRSVLAAVALLLAVQFAAAEPPPGSSKLWPWNVQGYQGYQESRKPAELPPPPHTAASPQRYTLSFTVLPQKHDDANTALMMAHLPEDGRIWFEDAPTQQQGMMRWFTSPTLTPGKDYNYTVRVQWHENGQWVSQMHNFLVHAGDIHCIDIVPNDAQAVEKEVAANLAKLDPEDRKIAEEQRFCAVQEGIRLGSMGTPVKIMLKDQPIFLCCKGCVDKARSNPDQTLEKVQKIKAKKNTGSPSP